MSILAWKIKKAVVASYHVSRTTEERGGRKGEGESKLGHVPKSFIIMTGSKPDTSL